jgi:hypothetical protein
VAACTRGLREQASPAGHTHADCDRHQDGKHLLDGTVQGVTVDEHEVVQRVCAKQQRGENRHGNEGEPRHDVVLDHAAGARARDFHGSVASMRVPLPRLLAT